MIEWYDDWDNGREAGRRHPKNMTNIAYVYNHNIGCCETGTGSSNSVMCERQIDHKCETMWTRGIDRCVVGDDRLVCALQRYGALRLLITGAILQLR